MMFDEITTARLRLVPFDDDTARAVFGGDLSGVDAVEGWPHDGTMNGLQHAVDLDEPPVLDDHYGLQGDWGLRYPWQRSCRRGD